MLGQGRVGELFAAPTTTPMRRDRPVAFDVSSIDDAQMVLQGAALMACWSFGFGAVNIANALADAGLEPRRHYFVVLDELRGLHEAWPGVGPRRMGVLGPGARSHQRDARHAAREAMTPPTRRETANVHLLLLVSREFDAEACTSHFSQRSGSRSPTRTLPTGCSTSRHNAGTSATPGLPMRLLLELAGDGATHRGQAADRRPVGLRPGPRAMEGKRW